MTGSLPARPDKEYPQETIRDESAHGGSAVEWWFVQGYYDGAGSGRRYFMTVAFRVDLGSPPPSSTVGFSSLFSVLDPRTSQLQNRSEIDPVLFNSSVHPEGPLPQHNLDPQMLKLCQREMAEHGPLRPIFLEEAQVKLQSAPFLFAWKDFSLAQSREKFLLKFVEPISKRVCEFDLVPSAPRLKVRENAVRSMSCYSYPRLQLHGKVNDEAADGVAWLDHQWGDWNWFFAQDSGRVLGWDWFGFNLDDGSDWVVLVHRDAATGKPMASHVTMRDRQGQVHSCQDLQAKPTRYWLSQVTHIRHPVAWDIQIPDLGATFTFEPIVEDQEIAIFSMAQAVWEGAGRISGIVGKRRVSGRARGEFHGYGYVFDFQSLLRDFGERVDQRIEAFLPRVIDEAQLQKYLGPAAWKREPEAYTPLLSGPVWDLLSRRSKHWRPVFALLLLEALGAPSNVYEDLAVLGAELPHTGALIIDDIEDSSQIRRGEECIHLRYGLDVAINAANTLYFLPSLYIMKHPQLSEGQRIRIYEVIWKSYVHAHFGQALDIYWSRNLDRKKVTRWIDDDLRLKILQMYDDKTGAIVEALAEIAVVIAGSGEPTRQACVHFARNMAVAFQIVDDILNFSETSEWTKTCGEDLKEGKLTYVITRAIELLESSHKERLVEILCNADLRKTASTLQEGIELVQRSGALADCRSEAESMFRAAWNQFSASIAPSYAKILLHMLCIRTLRLSGDP